MSIDRRISFDYPAYWDEPEGTGLELIASLEDPGACYSFDIFAVWRDTESGDLFYDHDSGCSCPSPFGNIGSLSSLTRLDPNRWAAFEADVEAWNKNDYGDSVYVKPEDVKAFFNKVKAALA
jgi:hypothetical protein